MYVTQVIQDLVDRFRWNGLECLKEKPTEYSESFKKKIIEEIQEKTLSITQIYAMGLLHDVGKIGVSEDIINKTSRLSDAEFASIKNHTNVGYDILKSIKEMPFLAVGAKWHHERYDGSGYPDGLAGEDIPLEARIICVADSYDAMTSKRSYSAPKMQSDVRQEFVRCSGTQFDPVIADIMIRMIDDDIDYKMRDLSE